MKWQQVVVKVSSEAVEALGVVEGTHRLNDIIEECLKGEFPEWMSLETSSDILAHLQSTNRGERERFIEEILRLMSKSLGIFLKETIRSLM